MKRLLLAAAFCAVGIAFCGSASAQEEIIGGGVYLPSGSMIQPLMSVSFLLSSGTANAQGAVNGPTIVGGMAGARPVPIPTAGKIQGLYANLAVGAPASPVVTKVVDNITTTSTTHTDKNVTCTFTPGTTPCNDPTDSDALSPGDSLFWNFSVSGTGAAWNQGANAQLGAEFVPTDGVTGILVGGPAVNPSMSTTAPDQYVGFAGGGAQGSISSEAQVQVVMPEGGTIESFYFSPNNTTSGTAASDQTVALCINSTSCTGAPVGGMQCTLGASTQVGCCVAVVTAGTHVPLSTPACGSASPISFNKGDTISVHIYCGTTPCVALLPTYSISYIPANPGQSIIVAQSSFVLGSSAPDYSNLIDIAAGPTQNNYGLTPWLFGKTITFGNVLFCSNAALSGLQTRQIDAQEASSPGTAPTTISSTTVLLGASSSACPGSAGSTMVEGNTGSFTWTAGSGYSVDTKYSAANITTGTALYKTSMTATIR